MRTIHVRFFLITVALLHFCSPRVIQPEQIDIDDDDSVYIPRSRSSNITMETPYTNSIPLSAIRACEANQTLPCPSTSSDGTHKCVSHQELCDRRAHCPLGEDETPLICFFRGVLSDNIV